MLTLNHLGGGEVILTAYRERDILKAGCFFLVVNLITMNMVGSFKGASFRPLEIGVVN